MGGQDLHACSGWKNLTCLDITGQPIHTDSDGGLLTYAFGREIRRYDVEGKESRLLLELPEEVWDVEQLDRNNYLLHSHPEYYFIYNKPEQKIYRYQQERELVYMPDVLKYSPSGCHMMKKNNDQTVTITEGDTKETWDLELPDANQMEWYSDKEIMIVETLNPNEPNNELVLEQIYDIYTGTRVKTKARTTTYHDTPMQNIREGCYYYNDYPVLSNALILHQKTYPQLGDAVKMPEGVPVGVYLVNSDNCQAVYYDKADSSVYRLTVANKDIRLLEGMKS